MFEEFVFPPVPPPPFALFLTGSKTNVGLNVDLVLSKAIRIAYINLKGKSFIYFLIGVRINLALKDQKGIKMTNSMNVVNVKEAFEMLQDFASAKLPVCMIGPAGVGKSSIVAQLCDYLTQKTGEMHHLVDLRLSQMDPSDLRGILFPNKETKTADWFAPSCLPHDPDWKGVVLLDEIFSAPQMLQAAAYQLVLDRKLGEYTLPEGAVIIAAGNGNAEKGLYFKMLSPLANRFAHVSITPDFEVWKEWAMEGNKIHPFLLGFLEMYRNRFHEFTPNSTENAFPTPRTWEFLSKMLPTKVEEVEDKRFMRLASAWVGSSAALDLLAFKEVMTSSIKADDVLSGKKYTVPSDKGVCFALQCGIVYAAKEKKDRGEDLSLVKEALIGFVCKVLDEHGEAMATSFFQDYARYAGVTNFSDPNHRKEIKEKYREFVSRVRPIIQESIKK